MTNDLFIRLKKKKYEDKNIVKILRTKKKIAETDWPKLSMLSCSENTKKLGV